MPTPDKCVTMSAICHWSSSGSASCPYPQILRNSRLMHAPGLGGSSLHSLALSP